MFLLILLSTLATGTLQTKTGYPDGFIGIANYAARITYLDFDLAANETLTTNAIAFEAYPTKSLWLLGSSGVDVKIQYRLAPIQSEVDSMAWEDLATLATANWHVAFNPILANWVQFRFIDTNGSSHNTLRFYMLEYKEQGK